MDEFAMGSSTENSAFGATRNPWDTARIPGGSSGGSAAAVAAGECIATLGSDTGGSIRQPAALCGVVGVKPTYGRVSRYGLVAFASSLDQIGPFARTVDDAALVLDAICGHDPQDATSSPRDVPRFSEALSGHMDGARIGVPRHLLEKGVDPDVLAAFEESLRTCERLGARVIDVELPYSQYAIPVYYLIATAEASSNLARYDGVRYGARTQAATLGEMYDRTRSMGFGDEVKRRIVLGTYVLSSGYYDAYYLKAQQVRTLIRRDLEQALEKADVVAVPTTPTPAFKLGERTDDPLQMYLGDIFTVSAPLAGLPAISVPCGFTTSRLPVGLHLTSRAWDEATMLRLANAYEQASPWSGMHPQI
jgi:aspartyl-tRNA(Asn)/glutamyl-tRNA(Gln) amidotransferase subunit A